MSVKILRRTHAPLMNAPAAQTSTSIPGLLRSKFNEVRNSLSPIVNQASRARKSADPEGFSAGERIREFIFQNAPKIAQDMDMEKLGEIASKLKMPLVVAVGVAAAAGFAYLIYKLYTNRATIAETIDNIMADLKSIAPDLSKIEGWAEHVKKEVSEALSSHSADTALERIVKIKDAVLNHQVNTSGRVGHGINFLQQSQRRPVRGRGAGLKTPMY